MPSFFQKVEATLCPGEMDPRCDNFVNQQRLPSHKRRCDLCGSTLQEIPRPDAFKIGFAVIASALLLGVGMYAVRVDLTATILKLFGSVSDKRGNPGAGKPRDSNHATTLTSIQIESDSGARLSLSELEKVNDTTFRSRQSYRAGDKFRFHVDAKMSYLYVYHRNGSEAKKYAWGTGATAILPAPSDWFQLDNTSGIEEFVVVASNFPVGALDQLVDDLPDPARLEGAVRSLAPGKDVQVTRVLLTHQ